MDGRLNVDELNARLPTALNAFTREDLYRILDDLVPSAALPAVVAEQVPLGDGPGMRWENPLLIRRPVVVLDDGTVSQGFSDNGFKKLFGV